MKHRPFVILAVVLLIAFFASFIYQVKDLTSPISRTESLLIESLKGTGIGSRNVVSREEEFWDKHDLKGKTVRYIFDPDHPISFTDLTSRLKKELKKINSAKLSRIIYKRSAKGSGVVQLEITMDDNLVISVKINNIEPVWTYKNNTEH